MGGWTNRRTGYVGHVVVPDSVPPAGVWHFGTEPGKVFYDKELDACHIAGKCIRIKLSLGGTLCLSPILDIVALPYSPSFW